MYLSSIFYNRLPLKKKKRAYSNSSSGKEIRINTIYMIIIFIPIEIFNISKNFCIFSYFTKLNFIPYPELYILFLFFFSTKCVYMNLHFTTIGYSCLGSLNSSLSIIVSNISKLSIFILSLSSIFHGQNGLLK